MTGTLLKNAGNLKCKLRNKYPAINIIEKEINGIYLPNFNIYNSLLNPAIFPSVMMGTGWLIH